MAETTFYILGGALVVLALLLSAVGLRWGRFPGSGPVLGGIVAIFAAVVVATGAFAWINAEDEQSEHAAELAEERAAAAEERAEQQREAIRAAEGAPADGDAGGENGGGVEAGQQVFDDAGCGGCHTLAAAGSSADVGPVLDDVLPGQNPAEIERSIVDPSAEIASGFQDQMPGDFGDRLDQDQLDALVEFLVQSTS